MDSQKLLESINLIREKAENNKLIVFVGAGVSRNVEGMPSWYALVKAMADAIHYSKCDDCKHREDGCEKNCRLREEYSNDEFLKIPQYVYNKNPDLYNHILAEQIKEVSEDAPLSKAIFDINPTHIITTNYDTLLESSKSELREQYQVIVRDKDLLESTKNKYIIKMHGDLLDISTIVLKEQDYLNYSQNRVLIELFIKSLLTDHVVLFLGYSLNDYNIKQIISWLNYMRSQNDALKGVKVGYIVFDEDNIDERQQTYFENNSIGIINIHNMPQVEDVPFSLKDEKGRRLYSLLRVVENPSLESNFEPQVFIKHFLEFAKQYSFIDYKNLLNLLHIGRYEKTEGELSLFDQKNYDKLKSYLDTSTPEAIGLKQRFIDAGIGIIGYWNPPHDLLTYKFYEEIQPTLCQDKAFELYLTNNYKELESLISKDAYNSMRACFYHSLSSFYDGAIYTAYDGIDFNFLTRSQKTTFLINKAYLDLFKTHNANYKKVKAFINNTSRKSERECLSFFADMFDGYSSKKSYIEKQFAELKNYYQGKKVSFGGGTLRHFYKIQNIAIELYNFIFYNNIFIEGVAAEIKEIFSLYIESIVYTNGEYSPSESDWFGIKSSKEKYQITIVDVDIMTKFISTEKLIQFFDNYHIKKLSTQFAPKYAVDIFHNLVESILTLNIHFRSSIWHTLVNLAVLLNYVELDLSDKSLLEVDIVRLFTNDKFDAYFFSVAYPDFRVCLKVFANLCGSVIAKSNYKLITSVLKSKNFFDYENNTNQYSIQAFLKSFIKDEDEVTIKSIIDSFENVNQKLICIGLLFKSFPPGEIKEEIKKYIEMNLPSVKRRYFLDFILNDFIALSEEETNSMVEKIIAIDDKQSKTHTIPIPDPLESEIERLCLLILTDKISNLDILKRLECLNKKNEFLEFILHPDTFDFNCVNFSYYMWANFARCPKYMDKFIKAKEILIPKIQHKIEIGAANEDEKKILYGFLLDKETIWNR